MSEREGVEAPPPRGSFHVFAYCSRRAIGYDAARQGSRAGQGGRPGRAAGQKQGARKMIDIQELKRLWESGETGPRLAKRFGVGFSHIYRLRRKHNIRVTLRNSSSEPPAPSKEDDVASKARLELAPWVVKRIEELKANGVIVDREPVED